MKKGSLVVHLRENEKISIGDVEVKILSSKRSGARVLVRASKDIIISEKTLEITDKKVG